MYEPDSWTWPDAYGDYPGIDEEPDDDCHRCGQCEACRKMLDTLKQAVNYLGPLSKEKPVIVNACGCDAEE